MDFQRIDLARWERREHYLHYMNAVVCSYSLTTELDVTPLSGRRLYPALLWLLTATVNELPAFRTSLMDGEPVVFSDMHPSYTVFHRQTETFSVLRIGFDRDYTVFEKAYEAEDRHAVQDERWSVFTREQITEKGNSLDLGLIRDDSVLDYNDLPDPAESAEEAAANLEEAVDLLMSVVKELRALEVRD